jgi:hypothetical protein
LAGFSGHALQYMSVALGCHEEGYLPAPFRKCSF